MGLKKKLLESKLGLSLLASLGFFLLLSFLLFAGVAERQQLSLSNYLYSYGSASPEIIIIEIDDKSLQEIGRWPWERKIFAELLKKLEEAKAKVIGLDVSFLEKTPEDPELEAALSGNLSGKVILSLEYQKILEKEGKFYGQGLLKPVIKGEYGLVNLFVDSSGTVRSFPFWVKEEWAEEKYHLNLGVKVAEAYAGKKFELKEKETIHFFSGFKKVSFVDVLKERTELNFENRIILIGVTAPDLHDDYLVPVLKGKRMPGVEIQANIVQTILSGKTLREQNKWEIIAVLLLLSLLLGLGLGWLAMKYSWLFVLALLGAYFYLAKEMFRQGMILNLIYPLLLLVLGYGLVLGVYYARESWHRQWITRIFGKYVSEEVAKEILKKGYDEKLLERGKRREITVMFMDIRGFTSLSEKLKPEEVVDLLNLYLKEITAVIFKYEGTIDKYIGDAVMAIWNAPLEQKEHPLLAVKAGLEIQEVVARLSRRRKIKIGYGIGINTGPAVVGNIGSERRMEYTAIGDAVNLGSRMCGVAKAGEVIIPEEVYLKVKEKIKAEDLGEVKVKGKENAVQVYRVLKLK